ncbi:hypothetical protein N7493_004265 [Penicillium malachiteum]|uniref:Uncharacterized protein n=1 Tax=Penicillium malachiteum TaxID=1324776 RepID=A0AAD6MYL6_9EURO|nr:hypothetical protein N7493_004265 [Penicillium malachiteum]
MALAYHNLATGSSRRPAMANGAFQIRLTHDAIPLTNVVPSFPSIDSLEKYVGVWLNQEITTYADNQPPTTIIYLTDFLPIENNLQMDLINDFISDIETALDVETEKISLADTWQASPPQGVADVSVHEYLKDVKTNITKSLDRIHVNPTTRFRWDLAKDISTETHEGTMRGLEVYKEWLLEHILQIQKRNALVIFPITGQEVDYRETPPPIPKFLFSEINNKTVGELKYQSRISGSEEHLPVVVSALGKSGSDMALIDAIKKVLKHSGRPTEIRTGRRMFQ